MPNIGIGIDFIHLKIFMGTPEKHYWATGKQDGEPANARLRIGGHITRFSVSHGVNYLGLSASYRWLLRPTARVPSGSLQPHVTASIGPCIPHHELDIPGDEDQSIRKAYSYQLGFPNWGVALSGGVRWRWSHRFALFAEYKFTYTILDDLRFDDGSDGRAWVSFFGHHYQWGLALVL